MTKDFTTPHPDHQKSNSGAANNDGVNPSQTYQPPPFIDGTHSVFFGYIMWIFGWMGAHRFYYGKPVSGTIWFLTGGVFLIGWIIDLFLIPSMDREADLRFKKGPYDHTIAFLLLTFLGVFGVHRFYIGKIFTGLLYLVTLGIFGLGLLYDFWTMNEQVSEKNALVSR